MENWKITGLDGTYHGNKIQKENTEKIEMVRDHNKGQTWTEKLIIYSFRILKNILLGYHRGSSSSSKIPQRSIRNFC